MAIIIIMLNVFYIKSNQYSDLLSKDILLMFVTKYMVTFSWL